MVKKLSYILLLTVALASCQVIPNDNQMIPVEGHDPQRRVLLVEFTGIGCVNCPNAAAQAHELLAQYPQHLTVVEVHSAISSFTHTAIPANDFTCPEADTLFASQGGTATTPLPTGCINLQSGLQDFKAWPQLVYSAVRKPAAATLQLEVTECDVRSIVLRYSCDGDSASLAAHYTLMLWLVEDSIVAPQSMPDGSTMLDYVHNHVLRGSVLASIQGEPYCPAADGERQTHFVVPEGINGQTICMENCSVVAVLSDAQGHVVDATSVALRKDNAMHSTTSED